MKMFKKNKNKISKNCVHVQKCNMCNGNTIRKRKRESNRRNIWRNNRYKFSKTNYIHQTTGPGSSENTKQDKYQKMCM